MEQIKSRHEVNDKEFDVYCNDDDFSLERALRDSFDSLPTSNDEKKYSFLVHKWGVDLDIHKSNEMLRIILDHLLEGDQKLSRLGSSLDILHVDDTDLLSDDEDEIFINESHIRRWLETKRTFPKQKLTQDDPIEKSPPTKKAKTTCTESVPHELTSARKLRSSSPIEKIPRETISADTDFSDLGNSDDPESDENEADSNTQSKPLQCAAGCDKDAQFFLYCSVGCRLEAAMKVPNKDSSKKRTGAKDGIPSPDESPATAENHSPDVLTELCNSLADDDHAEQSCDTANTGSRI